MTDYLYPPSIPSAGVSGSPTAAAVLSPASISSSSSFGTPGVAVVISPASITSISSVPTPFVASPIFLGPPSIPSGESFKRPIAYNFSIFAATSNLEFFTGELRSPILGNSAGNVFISPSFEVPNPNNILDIDYVSTQTNYGEIYTSNKVGTNISQRPFLFGPPQPVVSTRVYPPDVNVGTNYIPAFNSVYKIVGTTNTNVRGVLDTGGGPPYTYIFY